VPPQYRSIRWRELASGSASSCITIRWRPALILQGATDHQVTPEQADKLAAAMRKGGNRDVTVRVFPGLNHLFVPDTSGEPSGYVSLKSSRVSADVLGTLADWLVLKLGAGQ
jgi:dienelactone hydrolase